ncbi:hypothetical protein HG530_008396 [Fusarium avenaceum]|nr:hypothetical protein HG530_008396 [Fusarium avenaceum]
MGLSLLISSAIVSQANAFVISAMNTSSDLTKTIDGLATITSAPSIAQPFEVNTCSYYNATESRTLWNNPWCSMSVGTVDLVFWPTTGDHSYPSTYRDSISDYTFTSPSVYMIVNTMYAENPCGPLGPSASREIFAFDLTEVSTLVPYTDDIASTRRATRQLYLSDLGTRCTRSFNRTELATQTRPTKDDDTRCNPFLTVPKKFKEYGYPYWLHCGIKNNKFGVFDPPYAIPALDELIPAHTTSVPEPNTGHPTVAPSAPGKAPTNPGSAETAATSLHHPKPTLTRPIDNKPAPDGPAHPKPAPDGPAHPEPAADNPRATDSASTLPGNIEPVPAGTGDTKPIAADPVDAGHAPTNPGNNNPAPVHLGTADPAPPGQGQAEAKNTSKNLQATVVNSGNTEPTSAHQVDAGVVADLAPSESGDGLSVPKNTINNSNEAKPTTIGQVNDGTVDGSANSKDGYNEESAKDTITPENDTEAIDAPTGSSRRKLPEEALQSAPGPSNIQKSVINTGIGPDPTSVLPDATSTMDSQVMNTGTARLEVVNKDTGETSTYAVSAAGTAQSDGDFVPASVAVYSGHTVTQGGLAMTVTSAIMHLYPETSTDKSKSSVTTGGNGPTTLSTVSNSAGSKLTRGTCCFVLILVVCSWLHL